MRLIFYIKLMRALVFLIPH